MKEHNIKIIFETLAKIFEEKENCKITVQVKQNKKENNIQITHI